MCGGFFHGVSAVTIQQTLFDDERPAKIARASDPETSHDAAAEMLPKLGLLEQRFLNVMRSEGPMTANETAEIAERWYRGTPPQATCETFRKRYTGLLKKCRIVADGKKRCRISGKLATVYRLTEDE